jgi:hypothetical protein
VNIGDSILSNELLVDYLVRGIVDADAIRAMSAGSLSALQMSHLGAPFGIGLTGRMPSLRLL